MFRFLPIVILFFGLNALADSSMDSKEFFKQLSAENISLVDQFYAENAVLEDPVGKHQGREQIKAYYLKLYKNVISIRFEFHETINQGNQQILIWTMHLKVKGIKGGNEVATHGNSHIIFRGGKAIYHRDY